MNMDYSVVIPIYKRSEIILKTLDSILMQHYQPIEILIIDNNHCKLESNKLNLIVSKFSLRCNISINIIKSFKNSGALARNIGANYAKGELIAFLDSDVVLDLDYYSTLINYFIKDQDLIGIQGVDKSFIESQIKDKDANFLRRLLLKCEDFFETGTLLNREFGYVSPSLAVGHPNVLNEFEVKSQWISTCAGLFKKYLFKKYYFPTQFVTYSNNEYLFFSYQLFLNDEGKMLYTSKAKYKDVQTSNGRINNISLMYQVQAYDYYIFFKLFKFNFVNILIFFKSRIGHLILNILRLIRKGEFSLFKYFHAVCSIIYPLIYLNSILKEDLSFYEKDFKE